MNKIMKLLVAHTFTMLTLILMLEEMTQVIVFLCYVCSVLMIMIYLFDQTQMDEIENENTN